MKKKLIISSLTLAGILISCNPEKNISLEQKAKLTSPKSIHKFIEELETEYDLEKNDTIQITIGGPPNIIINHEKKNYWQAKVWRYNSELDTYELSESATGPIRIEIPKKYLPQVKQKPKNIQRKNQNPESVI